MRIQFSYPYWGSKHLSLEVFFRKIKDEGYSGVEMGIPFDIEYTNELSYLLKKYDLSLIAQQTIHQANLSAKEYAVKMEEYLYHLASFRPEFINSHTGRDYYSFSENCELFKVAEVVAAKTGVPILHETHRGRALFCTTMTQKFLDVFPTLKITADFSHWCCVSESLLQEQQDFVKTAIRHTNYIHARIGNEQSPQINHPGDQENERAVNAHIDWWKQIVARAKETGQKEFWICTEFGPPPYLQTLPFTNRTVANQFEVNLYMKKLLENTFDK